MRRAAASPRAVAAGPALWRRPSAARTLPWRRSRSGGRAAPNLLTVRACAGEAGGGADSPAAIAADGRPAGAPRAGEPWVVTTPLYYANAAPHMGSAYTTIAADVLARYARSRGAAAKLVTGVDEHGEKVAAAAAAAGLTPQAHTDAVSAAFRSLWTKLDIAPDAFVRTTDAKHAAVVADVLERVWSKDDIFRGRYEGWYCVGCEEYKDETDLVGPDRRCPLHDAPAAMRAEDNWFFRLSRYQADVASLLASPTFLAPPPRRNEVAAWVDDGLRDFSISRAAVAWGLPLPRDPDQTVYVWFDALLGYASALLADGETVDALPAKGWPPALHLVGKDILRFHAAYWPAMLLSAGLPLPRRVFAHGFLTKDGRKMGKSLGNVLDPVALVDAAGADAVRFFFIREVAFGADGDYAATRFADTVNAALANTLGNLVSRCSSIVGKQFDGALPVSAAAAGDAHPSLRAAAADGAAAAAAAYDGLALHAAAAAAVGVAAAGNAALDAAAPWSKLKTGDAADRAAAGAALVAALEAARVAAVLLAPVTPRFSGRVLAALGVAGADEAGATVPAWESAAWGGLAEGAPLPPATPLFARLEPPGGDGDAPPPPPPAAKGKGGKGKKAAAAAGA